MVQGSFWGPSRIMWAFSELLQPKVPEFASTFPQWMLVFFAIKFPKQIKISYNFYVKKMILKCQSLMKSVSSVAEQQTGCVWTDRLTSFFFFFMLFSTKVTAKKQKKNISSCCFPCLFLQARTRIGSHWICCSVYKIYASQTIFVRFCLVFGFTAVSQRRFMMLPSYSGLFNQLVSLVLRPLLQRGNNHKIKFRKDVEPLRTPEIFTLQKN